MSMSKRKQTRTKRDNMDTSLDTSSKTNKNFFFPRTLENKIVYYPDYEPNNNLEKNKVRKLLQEYIDT